MKHPSPNSIYGQWILPVVTIVICIVLRFIPESLSFSASLLIFAAGLIPVGFMYRSSSTLRELFIVPLSWFVFFRDGPGDNMSLYFLPFVTVLLVLAGARMKSRTAVFLVFPVFILWLYQPLVSLAGNFSLVSMLYIASSVATFTIYVTSLYQPVSGPLRDIDILLCSYSGNTAHLTSRFIKGAERAGATIKVHRFHYYSEFHADFTGGALVVAFPVIGWKPPWPLFDYLIRKLPYGHGKPAFILFSAAGGPENAGFLTWLLLTLHGYRATGCHWSMYPISVPTFRLGPARLWRFLDKLLPSGNDTDEAERVGEEFTSTVRAGQPVVAWPFILFIPGFILDNKWIDTVFYRNYAWKRRCVGCGKCVEYCPSGRLRMVDGRPAAYGTCALCLGCINICPKNAMHMVCWTEYGNQYKPRWPEHVVKNKQSLPK